MVGLVIRKSLCGLLEYFAKDFCSPMWLDERKEQLARPRTSKLQHAKVVPCWRDPLELNEFRELVDEADGNRKSDGILGLELGFAPPKSVSIAGLADSMVSVPILEAHRSAVDDALSFLSPLLFARANKELVPCGVKLLKFLHPWNRSGEPQMHSHVLFLRDSDFKHALWTTPIFMVQRALRDVYHYSLCERLSRIGLAIRLDEPGSLAWELAGVPDELLEVFSERSKRLKDFASRNPRGYFSQGAEFRVAGWSSRRKLPQTDSTISLAEARAKWKTKMVSLELSGESPKVETGPIALGHVFRMSSLVTRQQFIGTHLRWWLGATQPCYKAVALAGQILDCSAERGDVLKSGIAYCWPAGLKPEGLILKEISSAFGEGVRLQAGLSVKKSVRNLLGTDGGIKVISMDGDPLPKNFDLKTSDGNPFKGEVILKKSWHSEDILQSIRGRGKKPIVIFVEEPCSIGDFGARVQSASKSGILTALDPEVPGTVLGQQVVICKGGITGQFEETDHSSASDNKCLDWPLESVSVMPWLKQEEIDELNWNRSAAVRDGHNVNLLRIVPGESLWEGCWEAMGVFATRNVTLPLEKKSSKELFTIRHGTAWFFTGPEVDGVFPVMAVTNKKVVPAEAIKKMVTNKDSNLLLVQRIGVKIRRGIPLRSPRRFVKEKQVFRPGEVFVVESVDENGRIHFQNKSFWPSPHIILEPAFFVREFSRHQDKLPHVRFDADRQKIRLGHIKNLPPTGLLAIFSNNPLGFCQQLNRELEHQVFAKLLNTTGRIMDGSFGNLGLILKDFSFWERLCRESTELKFVSSWSTQEQIQKPLPARLTPENKLSNTVTDSKSDIQLDPPSLQDPPSPSNDQLNQSPQPSLSSKGISKKPEKSSAGRLKESHRENLGGNTGFDFNTPS